MKKRLLDLLICPACLPAEKPLHASLNRAEGEDILSGHLACTGCGIRYPVKDGVAHLLPSRGGEGDGPHRKYETGPLISAYLWGHYGDLFGDPEAGKAYKDWASRVGEGHALAVDAGCAVGRFTFELSRRSEFTVGLDRSGAFVEMARRLMKEGRLTFPLITEGLLKEPRTIVRPETWRPESVEFIVADALALPFPRSTFTFLASLNLIDKIPKPLQHLLEMNRVARETKTRFLFADPFSWSAESARTEDWLGGKEEGRYAGPGLANVRHLLEGEGGVIGPAWQIQEEGAVSWMIRNHRNHREQIRSEFLVSTR